jgi:PAS domain S-box-containing protein
MSRLTERKLVWGFGLTLTVLGANALISYNDLAELADNTRHVVRSREILETVENVASAMKDAETARRGYLIDGNPVDLRDFERHASTILSEIGCLNHLTSDRPDQRDRCLELDRSAHARLDDCRASIARAQAGGPAIARELFRVDPFRRRLGQFFGLADAIEDLEKQLLEDRVTERRAGIWRAFVTFSIASTLALCLIGSIYALVRRYLAERSRAERTIRESEARVRLLLDSAGEGVYGVDVDGICTFCNPSALQLLGFESADQVLGRNMHELIHHTHSDGGNFDVETCPIFRTFRTGEGTLGEEDVFWRADGSQIPVEYRAHPIRRDGETLGAVVTFVDVAPRRRTETEMRLRERALKAIAQGVFITDPARSDEPIIYVNAAFERLTGYTQDEVAGRNIEFLRGPETRPQAIADLQAAFRERREGSVMMLSYRKDGSTFYNALTIAPVEGPDGRVTHFVGVVTDITATKRGVERLKVSEERLRLMVESVRDYAIFAIDLEGRVSSWNTGAERLFGYSESKILGQDAEVLFAPEDRLAEIPRLELQRAESTGRADDERWYLREDGSRFFASGLVTAVRDDTGNLLGYTKVARDITESKRAEAELRAAKEAAEMANRSKSSFLANMSHELRTPLNAIIGYSEMLEEEARDQRVDAFVPDLERIHTAGKHLLGLINDLLDLSKIEAGRMDLHLETFDLADLVRDVLATIEPMAHQRGNSLRLEILDDLGTMHADLTKVRQALLNLLSNAAKFTENGTITLRADRKLDSDGVERVLLEVADDGIGMSPDELSRLFRPFVQADASTTRRYGGTGLGLTITRRFCEMMGGEIAVASEPGVGSTFTIRLPSVIDVQRGDRQAVEVSIARPTPRGQLVLVIDDDPTVGDLMTRVLTKEGYRVDYASSGDLGLRRARTERPDVITLDVLMPEMDGWSVLSTLKSDPLLAEIPVILVTFVDDKNLGYALGASDFLTKPIDRGRLVSILREYRPDLPGGLALVVEDNPTARRLVRQMLEDEGWSVVEAGDGRAALERLEEARPDLVVLDLTLPVMDGFEFTAELRDRPEWRDLPILVTTARDLSADDHARLNGRVQAILQKGSFTRADLLDEVRRRVADRVRPTSDAAATRPS